MNGMKGYKRAFTKAILPSLIAFAKQFIPVMFSKTLLVITALAVMVSGHSTTVGPATPSPSISPCIIKCVTLAAKQNGCGGYIICSLSKCLVFSDHVLRPTIEDLDLKCVCTNAQFYVDTGLCLHQHCSATDQATAVAIKDATCAAG